MVDLWTVRGKRVKNNVWNDGVLSSGLFLWIVSQGIGGIGYGGIFKNKKLLEWVKFEFDC